MAAKFLSLPAVVVVLLFGSPLVTRAQTPAGATAQAGSQNPPSTQPVPPPVYTVTVVAAAPLPGVELPLEKIPAPVQTATERDLTESGALDLSDFLNRRLNGVHVNEVQGNPFQPDIN